MRLRKKALLILVLVLIAVVITMIVANALSPGRVEVGMTEEEVLAIMGLPDQRSWTRWRFVVLP